MKGEENKPEYCCEIMKEQLTYKCEKHGDGILCPDVVIGKYPKQNSYTLFARNAEYVCNFCPWCGAKLNDE